MPSHAVDVHVGARMRQRRTLLGMNQTKLAEAVGLTFQQIQKYERGSNRMGASRLFEFSKVLDVPVSYFFDEMSGNALAERPMSGRGRKGLGQTNTRVELEKGFLIKRETLELVRAYYKIPEARVRGGIVKMIKAIAVANRLPKTKKKLGNPAAPKGARQHRNVIQPGRATIRTAMFAEKSAAPVGGNRDAMLSIADPRASEVNRRPIQEAEDFLALHGRPQGGPRFE